MANRIRLKISLLLAALALVLAAALPAGAAAQSPLQLGVYLSGGGGNASTLDSYASMVGRKPDIFLVFRNMNGPLLYSTEVSNLKSRGETPMVTLELYTSTGVASLTDIAAGKYDAYFRKEAKAVKATGMTVMIRFAHEMNLLSSDWGPGKDGNSGSGYADAWRHVVDIFRQEGATNAKWVWAPNVDYGGRPFNQFFPGDDYVDYLGLDGYNWGTSNGGSWSSFSKIFASSYTTITQLSSRPLIITETASSETGGDKASWIEQSLLETVPKMPRISGVIWFNDNKERDWRVNSSQASLEAFRKVVASTIYGGTQAPVVQEEAPTVKELEVIPVVTPEPAPETTEPAPETTEPAPAPETTTPAPTEPAPAPETTTTETPTETTEPAPAPEQETTEPTPEPTPTETRRRHHKRRGMTLRGRITYRLSRRSTVRITLRRRAHDASPLVFTAQQNRGHKRVALAKLVQGRHVGRGKYSVSVVAFSRSGKRSHPRHDGFRVVPPAKLHRSRA